MEIYQVGWKIYTNLVILVILVILVKVHPFAKKSPQYEKMCPKIAKGRGNLSQPSHKSPNLQTHSHKNPNF
jgi:hypothetical protein